MNNRKHIQIFEHWNNDYKENKILNESFYNKDLNKVLKLVSSYLSKKIGTVSYSENIEKIKQNNNDNLIFGIRFLTNDPEMFRLNWKTDPQRNSSKITSVDFWIKDFPTDGRPEFKLLTDGFNIIQILAKIEEIIKNNKVFKNQKNDEEYIDSLIDVLKFYDTTKFKIVENFINDEAGRFSILKNKTYGGGKKNMTFEEKKELCQLWLINKGFRDVVENVFDVENVTQEENVDPEELKLRDELEEKLSQHIDISTKFKDMKFYIGSLTKGLFNSLIITGTSGVGKTYTVIETMRKLGLEEGKDWVLIKGKSSPIGMYKEFYKYRNGITLVFDDCDSVFRDENGINILKGALDSSEIRKISWKTGTTFDPEGKTVQEIEKLVDRGKIPNNFELSSQCLFITNITSDELLNNHKLAALLSRSLLMDMTFSEEEIIERIKTVMPHMDIYGLDEKSKEDILNLMILASKTGSFKKAINLRTFENMCKTKAAMDLHEITSEMEGDPVKFTDDDLLRMAITYS